MSTPEIEVRAHGVARLDEILSPTARAFLGELHRRFNGRRLELLAARAERQKLFDAGATLDFLAETAAIRDGDWKVAPAPADLADRRVEITGPVDRKMIVNALNSGAKVFMADFEDASSPVFANMIEGQANLKDLWAGVIDFTDERTGKRYAVGPHRAALMVRPRGWHLNERHLLVDGEEASGSLFDFGLYVFHCAKAQAAAGSTPAFYLPKLESHRESRLWNEVFAFAEQTLGFPNGAFKATVLIETLPAAFEMDEILYEMRDHIVGLNCGRWDYIFSFIKRMAKNEKFLTPDRAVMTMGKAFLSAYSLLAHQDLPPPRRLRDGRHGGADPDQGRPGRQRGRLRQGARRQGARGRRRPRRHLGRASRSRAGRDGGVRPADAAAEPARQERARTSRVAAADLLHVHEGERTEAGLRENIRVGVQYIEAWLRGRGAVPLYNLMEDAATAEISRAQIWQWLYHKAQARRRPHRHAGAVPRHARGRDGQGPCEPRRRGPRRSVRGGDDLFAAMSLNTTFEEFLTLPAYQLLD